APPFPYTTLFRSVGGDREQSPACPCGECNGAQEGRDRVSPPVPGRLRWHRDRCVVREHRDDGVDVIAFPGVDEATDELAQPVVSERLQGDLLALGGQSLVDGLVRAL